MLNICYINTVGTLGGAEQVLLASIKSVRERVPDSQISVILFSDGPLKRKIEDLGGKVVVLPLPRNLHAMGDSQFRSRSPWRSRLSLVTAVLRSTPKALGFVIRLQQTLAKLSPHLIHSNGFKAHTLSILAQPRGVPVLWHLHDFCSQRPAMARILKFLKGRAAGGIAISKAVQTDASLMLKGLPIRVVLNAVDTDHFQPLPQDASLLDTLAGLPSSSMDPVRIGIVATYANWKGQDVFLEAAALILTQRNLPSIRFYIIGGPIYSTAGSQFSEEELVAKARDLKISEFVRFIPFQDDPAPIYRSLDIVVHASTSPEPFGLTVVEAMSCGRAVIVSEAGGALELFTDGYDGLGHPPGNATQLANSMLQLITDPRLRTQLGTNARETVIQKFALKRYGDELVATYRDMVSPL